MGHDMSSSRKDEVSHATCWHLGANGFDLLMSAAAGGAAGRTAIQVALVLAKSMAAAKKL